MGLLDWLKPEKKQSTDRVAHLGFVQNESFTEFLLGGGSERMSAERAMRFYRQSSVLASVVDAIAEEIEMIRPVVQLEDGSYDANHPALEKLVQPNGFETRQEFIGQVARNWLINRDSVVYGAGNINRPPLDLYAVKPQNIHITSNRTDFYPDKYSVYQGPSRGTFTRDRIGGDIRFTDGNMREVYHIMGYSSRPDNIYADSPLLALRQEVRQQLAGRMHNLKLMENGGRLSLIATVKGNVDEDQQREIVQSIQESFGGPNNAGKIAVTFGAEGGIDYSEVGQNNKDMDYINIDIVSQNAIANRYKYPLPLLNTDASTFNNMETAIEMLYRNAVLPNFTTIYAGLSKFLLPRYGLDPVTNKFTYNPEDIEALRQKQLDELKAKFEMRAITTNEIRDAINLEPLEGGDTVLAPATLIPIGSDMFTDTDIADPEAAAKDMVDGA